MDIKSSHLAAVLAGMALLLVAAALGLNAPQANLLQSALVIAALGMSFQIIFGVLGQLSLGHSALFGAGAYVYALAASKGLAPWVSVPLAVLAAGVIGALISATTARLGGAYFAVVTYALAGIFAVVVSDTPALGGSDGMIGVRSLPALGLGARPADQTLYVGACFLIVLGGFAWLWRSRLGAMLETIRANPALATALGVNPVRAVILATGVSGLFAGLVGAAFAQHGRFVSPEAFGLHYVVTPLAAVAVGGSRYLFGAVLGSIVVVVIPLSLNISPILNQVFSGVLLTFFIIRFPGGLAGGIEALWRRWRPLPALPALAPLEQRVVADPLPQIGPKENILQARGIHLRYGAVHAVRGVDLDLRAGEVLGLIGANGAGKSSLVNALSGTVRMQQGTLQIAGKDATALPGYARARRGLARTFQNVAVVDELTLRAGMELAAAQGRLDRRPADRVALQQVLQDCGLGAAGDRRVGTLSYLHRRLFSIAMALATQPRVLFLDEATAGLTAQERTQIGALVRALAAARGIGIVVIEHDVGFVARVADRMVVMNEGAKIAEGSPEEVLADSRVVESYLGSSWDVARAA